MNELQFFKKVDMNNKEIVIYAAINKITNERYVGQTQDFYARSHSHIKQAFNKKSPTYNYLFQKNIREYGEEVFDWYVLETVNEKLASEKEAFYIKHFESYNNPGVGLNQYQGGNRNRPKTEAEKLKYSEMFSGENNPMFGTHRIMSEETKEKMSKSQTGKKHSEETKEKIRSANTGVIFSEERCRKISDSKKNKKVERNQNGQFKTIEKGLVI